MLKHKSDGVSSALIALLAIAFGLPVTVGFLALVVTAFMSGLNSMIAALPTWALIVAFGSASWGWYQAWKYKSFTKIRSLWLSMALLAFGWGAAMMFAPEMPTHATGVQNPKDQVGLNLAAMLSEMPQFLAWACLLICVVIPLLPVHEGSSDKKS